MSHEIKDDEAKETLNFIEHIVEEHNQNGRFNQRVHTRFPPEPNGFLHLGHAKAICVSFDLAQKYGGKTNLRFDDTNPTTEKTDFVEAIQRDIEWLGFDWEDRKFFASDYFQQLYDYAMQLVKKGKAYVDFSSSETMDKEKKQGLESAYRNTSIETNVAEFEKMKNGEYETGTCVLRLKIDMNSDNWLMRDPVVYRILNGVHHHRTGDAWNIYPMYDWAHGLSDSIEGITHSLCSLEFEVHRELYDWCLAELGVYQPQQIEFSRLNVSYTVTSKRKLKELIELGIVTGWDDPRMPTISAMRRRGYPPEAIKNFVRRAGVSKREQHIDLSALESCVREELNKTAPRVMGVLNPLKVIITNYPEGQVEEMSIINNPEDESMGSRTIPFSRELYIEKEDFAIEPHKKWRRLAPGRDVRFKGAYILHCTDFKTDENGEVVEVYCTYYENSKSGQDNSGIKAKGTLHWVSIEQAFKAKVRIYDRLFSDPSPTTRKENYRDENNKKRKRPINFKQFLNEDSLKTVTAYLEPNLKSATAGDSFQFMRLGYFCVDTDTTDEQLIFNRTVPLKDSWAKIQKK